mgnify:FL=1
MSFKEVFRTGGMVGQIATRLKQNDLYRFTNLPVNVYHWRTFDEPVEFPEVVSDIYVGARQAQKLLYQTLLQIAPKMHKLNFCVDLDYNMTFTSVFVYEGLECVGRITYSDNGSLEFTNARIYEAMYRKRDMKTRSVAKAVTIIRKYFYGMTKVERLNSVAERVSGAISSAHSDTVYKRRNAKSRVMEELEKAMLGNQQLMQAVKQFFQEENKPYILEQYVEAADTHELVEEAYRARGQGLYIHAVGNCFEVYRKGDTRVRTYQRDALPDKVRGALGMLKLSNDNSFVDNVGFKFEADKFWVAEEISNEFGN